MKLQTALDIAKKKGVAKQTITRLARLHKIGQKTSAGWVFNPIEAEEICGLVGRVGRPCKTIKMESYRGLEAGGGSKYFITRQE